MRLYRSIYLHGIMLLGLVALATGVVGTVLGRSAVWREYPERLATHLARQLGPLRSRPDDLRRELRRVNEALNVDVALYGPDGTLLGATGHPPVAPLDAWELPRLARGPISLRRLHWKVAVGYPDGGYLEMSLPSLLTSFFVRGILILGAVIGALALGSYPLARAVARPLERLSETARRLGEGDLTVRSGIRRSDEIGDLALALDDMAGRIQRLVQGERELLANVSHELRTPMARIRVALELAADGDPASARRYLGEIASDLAELERLVDDILATSRFDVQGAVPPLRRILLKPETILEEAASRFRAQHPGRALEIGLEKDLPEVEADPMLLRRVLDNLLDNAAKYSDAGPPIHLRARAAGQALEVEIEDEGIGIEPEDLPHLFTPFFRTDRSRARTTGGVGLGLTLARRILEAHGGTIEVESTPGKGTRVRLRLPFFADHGA
jgi:two-component system OmpR family sensor kinase